MENSIYIYHHLGMGDHILCNGLVRHFAELYKRVYLFAKPVYSKNVLYMYRDNPKIRIIELDDIGTKAFMGFNPENKYLVLGHTPEYFYRLDILKEFTFEGGFYSMAEIPLEYKWSKFYFQRDLEKEEKAFKIAKIKKGEEYLFIHDDPKRERIFKKQYMNSSIKAIHPTNLQEINLFHFFSIIENAKEIHIHNSSFANIIDTMELDLKNVYYHKYARTDCGDQTFSKKLNWKILEK